MCSVETGIGDLRQNLHLLGYDETLPISAVPLVNRLFTDLVQCTHSLRDAKEQIIELMQEKQAWALGVEPFKCESVRLLKECNEIHKQAILEREESEKIILDLKTKINQLALDNKNMSKQCRLMVDKLKLAENELEFAKNSLKSGQTVKKVIKKKPFISTVRSHTSNCFDMPKCALCSERSSKDQHIKKEKADVEELINNMEDYTTINKACDLAEYVKLLEQQVDMRNREIERLTALLSEEGRPMSALARECCYTQVENLTTDVSDLQKQKNELSIELQRCREKMHEAMQRSISLEEKVRKQAEELQDLKTAAMEVETQANDEVKKYESEIQNLLEEIKILRKSCEIDENQQVKLEKDDSNLQASYEKQHKYLHKKLHLFKDKYKAMQKDLNEQIATLKKTNDEQKLQIKELNGLIEVKRDEIKVLRLQLSQEARRRSVSSDDEGQNKNTCNVECVALLENKIESLEEERDQLRMFNNSLKNEFRERLKAKELKIEELQKHLETMHRNIDSLQEEATPRDHQIVRLKTEIEHLHEDLKKYAAENSNLREKNNALRSLQEDSNAILNSVKTNFASNETRAENKRILAEMERINDVKNQLLKENEDLMQNLNAKMFQMKSLQEEISHLREKCERLEHKSRTHIFEENQHDISILKQHLHESHTEVARLNKLLSHYMEKVTTAEQLLMIKEKEREEVLDQYRTLSENFVEHDVSTLLDSLKKVETEKAAIQLDILDRDEIITNVKSKLLEYISMLESMQQECVIAAEAGNYSSLKLSELLVKLENEICAVHKELNKLRDWKLKFEEKMLHSRKKQTCIQDISTDSFEMAESEISEKYDHPSNETNHLELNIDLSEE